MSTTTAPRRRTIIATVLAAAAATGALASAVPANAAPVKYVAMAYSPVDGASGWGMNENQDVANTRALFECGKRGGHCQLVSWSKNGCVALAASGPYYYGWHGATLEQAKQGALERTGPGARVLDAICA